MRLWSSLCDHVAHPAEAQLVLSAQRWEIELLLKKLQVEWRGRDRWARDMIDTAAQEIVALRPAQAILGNVRGLRSR